MKKAYSARIKNADRTRYDFTVRARRYCGSSEKTKSVGEVKAASPNLAVMEIGVLRFGHVEDLVRPHISERLHRSRWPVDLNDIRFAVGR